MSTIGDNSGAIDAGHLRAFIERIETIETSIKDAQEDRKEIYAELKSNGYDPKIVRKIIAIRKQDAAKRQEEEAILELYLGALGCLADLPLGRAAVEREFGGRRSV